MNETIKLAIVDDHKLIVEGLQTLLKQEKSIEWIGQAYTAQACLAFLKLQTPDIILMDISMPDKDGIALCKEVTERYPAVKIIALSTFNQQSFVDQMLKNGARGYLLKNAEREEIMEAINTVMNGNTYLSLEIATNLRNGKSTSIPILTRREQEILQQIAEGLTNLQIATKLFISVTTVDTHRKSLLLKTGANNTASLVKFAFQHNFL